MMMSPESGWTSSSTMRNIVVLPWPLRPTSPTRSRRLSAKERSSNRTWAPKLLVTLLNWIMLLLRSRQEARGCVDTFDAGHDTIPFTLKTGNDEAVITGNHVPEYQPQRRRPAAQRPVSYTHLRAHETPEHL